MGKKEVVGEGLSTAAALVFFPGRASSLCRAHLQLRIPGSHAQHGRPGYKSQRLLWELNFQLLWKEVHKYGWKFIPASCGREKLQTCMQRIYSAGLRERKNPAYCFSLSADTHHIQGMGVKFSSNQLHSWKRLNTQDLFYIADASVMSQTTLKSFGLISLKPFSKKSFPTQVPGDMYQKVHCSRHLERVQERDG